MPDFVNVVTPEGKAISVPAEAVGGLVEQGYRLESAAQGAARAHEAGVASQYDGALQQTKAAAYGLARGASLGLSDVALRLDNAGAADHLTAMLLLWSMSAGLVCGGQSAKRYPWPSPPRGPMEPTEAHSSPPPSRAHRACAPKRPARTSTTVPVTEMTPP